MGRIILPYGAIAGAVTIGTMIAFTLPSEDGVGGSVWLGFLVMILALSVIYLGIRRYRDHELGRRDPFSYGRPTRARNHTRRRHGLRSGLGGLPFGDGLRFHRQATPRP